MLKKRIVATLVIKDGLVVQSRGFTRYMPVGKPAIAMEFLDDWGIDEIILLDISMPVMDGWHFLEEYALLMPKMSKKNNLYMFSSSISQIDIERAKNNPLVKDYIFKPLQKQRFLEMVEELGSAIN